MRRELEPATAPAPAVPMILCTCGAVRDTGAACGACGELEPAPAQIPGQLDLGTN